MSQVEREVLKRLGSDGLRRALDDILDPARLVKLANACALRYPGMRTQSQKRERILADLVGKAEADEVSGRTIYRTLVKETATAARRFEALPPEERAKALRDGALGLHLFLVASSGSPEELQALLARASSGASRPTAEPAADPSTRDVARLRKKNQELQKKLQHLEGQIAKGRDAEKILKRELLQRKGELAELRMLVERLRRDLQGSQQTRRAEAAPKPGPPSASPASREAAPGLEELVSASRKLAQEQRKIAHALERLASAAPPELQVPAETLAPILEGIEDLRKDGAAIRKERKKDEKILEELRSDLRAFRSSAEQNPALPPASRRRKGDAERLGIFIDVQNVYYAARQLKGKLDFDALLHAVVRDRRLIQAQAYVVESQEIDQSGFIAMLQQRAIEVRRKTLKVRSDGSMKGDWDMEMALDILDAAPKLDVVVLVSGDGDFTSLVNRVKAIGPRVEVAAFPRATAKSLLEAADEFQALDRRFMIPARPGPAPAPEPPAPVAAPASAQK